MLFISKNKIKDMISSPKSSLLFGCSIIFNTIYKCLFTPAFKKKEEVCELNKRLREFLAFKNRFIFKSCEDEIKAAIENPGGIKDPKMPFKVSLLAIFFKILTGIY